LTQKLAADLARTSLLPTEPIAFPFL